MESNNNNDEILGQNSQAVQVQGVAVNNNLLEVSLVTEVKQSFLTTARTIIDSLIEKIEGEKVSEIGVLRISAGLTHCEYYLAKYNIIVYTIKWFGKIIMIYTEPYITNFQNQQCWVWKYKSLV